MKNSISYVFALLSVILFSNNVMAERKPAKVLEHSYVAVTQPVQVMALSGDTVDLTESKYGITDVEAHYYTVASKGYYSFSIFNWDDDLPELRIEFQTATMNKIDGDHSVDLALSYLELDDETKLSFSKASFSLSYVKKDSNGDPVYDISAVVDASNGKVYTFNKQYPVYAYNDDVVDGSGYPQIIVLEDGMTTSLAALYYYEQATKILRNGQFYIFRAGKVYTINGQIAQ